MTLLQAISTPQNVDVLIASCCIPGCSLLFPWVQGAAQPHNDHGTAGVPFIPSMTIPLDRRRRIGTMCKQLIDVGRLQFLRNHGFGSAYATSYVEKGVTGENCMLIGSRSA